MELAGELIQDLCAFLQITELESSADFPREFSALQDTLATVQESNTLRSVLQLYCDSFRMYFRTLSIILEERYWDLSWDKSCDCHIRSLLQKYMSKSVANVSLVLCSVI